MKAISFLAAMAGTYATLVWLLFACGASLVSTATSPDASPVPDAGTNDASTRSDATRLWGGETESRLWGGN